MFTCTKHKPPAGTEAAVGLLVGVAGVWDCRDVRASTAPAPPARRGICFHLALFTLQRPGCLRSADPSPQPLTGADEVLDRWL